MRGFELERWGIPRLRRPVGDRVDQLIGQIMSSDLTEHNARAESAGWWHLGGQGGG